MTSSAHELVVVAAATLYFFVSQPYTVHINVLYTLLLLINYRSNLVFYFLIAFFVFFSFCFDDKKTNTTITTIIISSRVYVSACVHTQM